MLENDSTKPRNPEQVDKSAAESEDMVKKPRKRRRRPSAKKQGLISTGLWPKIAIAAIILCLGLAGFSISLLNRDTTVPVIEQISVTDMSQISAIITWKTNEPATSEVSICSSDNCTSLKTDESLVINHSATLTDIEPNTGYQFTLTSKNKQGKEARVTLELVTPRKAAAIEIGTRVGDRAPDFTLPTIDGKEISLSQFRGKIVMVNFWVSSCSSCAGEMPDMQAVFDTWSRDDLEILAVNDGERAAFVQSFIDSKGLTFPALLDSDEAVSKMYQISTTPTTFFIDADGIIKRIKSGRFTSQSEIENILKSL
jgi:cytochrome c biogenesis protein CcmG, thiol:disulfide interchange protein DsbE